MARLHVSIYVETALGERPLDYTTTQVIAPDVARDVVETWDAVERVVDQATEHLRTVVRLLAREGRANQEGEPWARS